VAGPRREFTENEKNLIVALCGEGKTDAEVPKLLNIPRKTFTDRLKYNSLTATIRREKKSK